MVISQDGVNFDPAHPANRQVRIVATNPGPQSVTWDGLTNAGVPFPVGGPYPVEIDGHAGEYHFPMLDVENNLVGGPVITLLNPPGGVCPPWNGGCRGAFYDDRGYISGNGTAVGTPGQVLCAGLGRVPTPPFSDPVLGFDTASGQRGFGDPTRRQRQRAVRIRRLLRRHEGSRPLDLLPGRPDDDRTQHHRQHHGRLDHLQPARPASRSARR